MKRNAKCYRKKPKVDKPYKAVKPPNHTGVKLINSRAPASSMLKSSVTMTSIQPLHLDPFRTTAQVRSTAGDAP